MWTWTLWRALKKPYAHHPVFHRTIQLRKAGVAEVSFIARPARQIVTHLHRLSPLSWFVRPLLLLAALPVAAFLIFVLLYAGVPILMYGGPILLPMIANAHGLSWAIGIGSLIATEQERKTFDLLCVTPFGTLPTLWAIASGYAHYDKTLSTVSQLRAWQFAIIWIVIPFISSMVLLQFGQVGYYVTLIPVFIAYLAAFTAMLYIDQFQSIIVGVLIGMFVPTWRRAMQETRLLISGLFILIQALTYLVALLLSLGILPPLLDALNLRSVAQTYLPPILSVVFFALIHETIIHGLRRALWAWVGEGQGVLLPTDA